MENSSRTSPAVTARNTEPMRLTHGWWRRVRLPHGLGDSSKPAVADIDIRVDAAGTGKVSVKIKDEDTRLRDRVLHQFSITEGHLQPRPVAEHILDLITPAVEQVVARAAGRRHAEPHLGHGATGAPGRWLLGLDRQAKLSGAQEVSNHLSGARFTPDRALLHAHLGATGGGTMKLWGPSGDQSVHHFDLDEYGVPSFGQVHGQFTVPVWAQPIVEATAASLARRWSGANRRLVVQSARAS